MKGILKSLPGGSIGIMLNALKFMKTISLTSFEYKHFPFSNRQFISRSCCVVRLLWIPSSVYEIWCSAALPESISVHLWWSQDYMEGRVYFFWWTHHIQFSRISKLSFIKGKSSRLSEYPWVLSSKESNHEFHFSKPKWNFIPKSKILSPLLVWNPFTHSSSFPLWS